MPKRHAHKMLCLAALCIFFSASVHPQGGRDETANIASAVRARDFDQALSLLGPALKQSPQNAKLWTLQGLALSGKGDTKHALIAYQTALRIAPDFVPALEGAAQIEYNADSQDAVPLLKRLLRQRPDDPTSHAMLAVLASKKGDCATAVEHFALVGSLLDSDASIRQGYGECLLKLKRTDQAIAIYQHSLELNPGDNESRYQLAVAQLSTDQASQALETLAPLLQSEKPDAKTLEVAASAYEQTQNTQAAVKTLRQAIVLYPKDVDLYIDFAGLSMDHQSFDVGVAMVNVGLQAQPEAASLYVTRGVLYVQLGKYTEAEDDFEKAEQLDPNRQIASVAKGLEQAEENDPARALSTVRSRLAKKPNDPYLLYMQADVLAQTGPAPGSANFIAAVHSAKRAIALKPDFAGPHDVLAKLYLQAGENQAAIEQCREVLKVDPKDQTALYHLIQALRKTGNTKEVEDLVKRLAELRAESTKKEMEHNRYKLVEGEKPAGSANAQ
jgi:tetratricopeptide (TPR) repeat protein